METSVAVPAKKTRIQVQNQEMILDAALDIFSGQGFRGTTVDQIASHCGMSKPNLLYYFRRKDDIYTALLERTLASWLAPLRLLNPDGDPYSELKHYVSAKLEMSLSNPKESRLFANEILHGAPHIGKFLKGPLKELVDAKALVIKHWIAEGKMQAVDPHHLIFAIWAVTQHYADFGVQIEAIRGKKPNRETLTPIVLDILLRGLFRT
jgi:TetR/AcrR family transcriptional regulator